MNVDAIAAVSAGENECLKHTQPSLAPQVLLEIPFLLLGCMDLFLNKNVGYGTNDTPWLSLLPWPPLSKMCLKLTESLLLEENRANPYSSSIWAVYVRADNPE